MLQKESVVSSPARRLPLIKLNKVVKLKISERLQREILYLCNRISQVEWSSTLFYKIEEGKFGEDNCVLFADSQYLHDVGTQAYTEYTYEAEFFKYLMENPEYMDMQKGHLHSHNTMNVFFSGTDDSELITNSEFHNYYLSLIVNNKNEMTARVAFRVTKRSKINAVIDSVIEYRDSEGNMQTTDVKNETEEKEKVEQTVYYFDCEIIKPEMEADPLSARVNAVIEKKNAERAALAAKAAEKKPNALKSWEEFSEGGWDNWAKDKSSIKKKDITQRDLFDIDETDRAKEGSRKERHGLSKKAVKRIQGGDDRKAHSFIVALLSGDPLSRATLGEVLDILDDQLDSKHAVSKYVELMEADLMTAYMAIYPEDFNMDNCGTVVDKVCALLEQYRDTYEYLVDPIVTSLQTQTSSWK